MRKKISGFIAEHQGRILTFALGGIMALFIGILITVYFVAKQANPVFLDEKGRPVQTQNGTPRY